MDASFQRSRRHARRALRVPVRLSTIDPELDPRTGQPFFRATHEVCANLSSGGAFVPTPDPPAPGRRVLVEIHVPDAAPLARVGRVAWSRRVTGGGAAPDASGIGIEFVDAELPGELLARLSPERR